ncbi:unnamed protein product [Pleuronectes platessa]|uniref:Uncharacterized protein n=1 Tax=Pleuronectes platessa TaxID=8262 RepID=A0A9N7UL09_PLEPL|nr:unnamed protein product [Pleuronectes platessa]
MASFTPLLIDLAESKPDSTPASQQATFPEPGCDLCYSSCAVCPTHSWRDRKTDLENYSVYVIGDYRTAARALYLGTTPRTPSSLKASLLPSCKEQCESLQPCQPSSCGETGEEAPPGSPRRPQRSATFYFFL